MELVDCRIINLHDYINYLKSQISDFFNYEFDAIKQAFKGPKNNG